MSTDNTDLSQYCRFPKDTLTTAELLRCYLYSLKGDAAELVRCVTDQVSVQGIKELVERMRAQGVGGWGFISGLDTYTTPSDLSFGDQLDEVQKWFSGGTAFCEPGALAQVMKLFSPDSSLTIEQFLANPDLYSSPGATHAQFSDGRRLPNKTTFFMMEGPEKARQLLEVSTPAMYRAFVKRERGKARLVVAAEESLFLQQSFFARRMERSYSRLDPHTRGPRLTQLHSSEELAEDYALMYSLLRSGYSAWSLDYKSFDHQLSDTLVQQVLEALCPAFGDEEIALKARMLGRMRRGYAKVDNHKVPHRGGLPSGWRFTALLGSVANAALVVSVLGDLIHHAYTFHQGDDCVVFLPRALMPTKYQLQARCDAFGIVVNPFKTIWPSAYCEYLKMIISPEGVGSYPARSIPALRLRQAWTAPEWDDRALLRSWAASVKVCLSRGCEFHPLWARGAVRAFGSTAEMWRAAALMSTAVGGLGGGTEVIGPVPKFSAVSRRGPMGDMPAVQCRWDSRLNAALVSMVRSAGFGRQRYLRFRGFARSAGDTPAFRVVPQRPPRLMPSDYVERSLYTLWLRSGAKSPFFKWRGLGRHRAANGEYYPTAESADRTGWATPWLWSTWAFFLIGGLKSSVLGLFNWNRQYFSSFLSLETK